LSLTVPITNSLAFLFTVLGEWVVEKKVIGRGMVPLELDYWGDVLTRRCRYLDWDAVIFMWDCALCSE
jgi:hypothetical protein